MLESWKESFHTLSPPESVHASSVLITGQVSYIVVTLQPETT